MACPHPRLFLRFKDFNITGFRWLVGLPYNYKLKIQKYVRRLGLPRVVRMFSCMLLL